MSQPYVNGSASSEREGPATILVVDDDDRLVSSVRRVLAYEGYRVLTATNGSEGLQLARDESPDLIILDVMLPGHRRPGGREADPGRRRRAGPDALGERPRSRTRCAGLEAGADDYLVKPFAVEELLARVKARLRRREPGRPPPAPPPPPSCASPTWCWTPAPARLAAPTAPSG